MGQKQLMHAKASESKCAKDSTSAGTARSPVEPRKNLILKLQQTIGNQRVQELLKSGFVTGKPYDRYEIEAEKTPNALAENLLKTGRVNIHKDVNAAEMSKALGARAFAVGNDIFFGTGQYKPGTPKGDRLISHELNHVVQQSVYGLKTIQRAELCSSQPETALDVMGENMCSTDGHENISVEQEVVDTGKKESMTFRELEEAEPELAAQIREVSSGYRKLYDRMLVFLAKPEILDKLNKKIFVGLMCRSIESFAVKEDMLIRQDSYTPEILANWFQGVSHCLKNIHEIISGIREVYQKETGAVRSMEKEIEFLESVAGEIAQSPLIMGGTERNKEIDTSNREAERILKAVEFVTRFVAERHYDSMPDNVKNICGNEIAINLVQKMKLNTGQIKQVFVELGRRDENLLKAALFGGGTIIFLLKMGHSGFNEFWVKGEGLLAGMIRGEYESKLDKRPGKRQFTSTERLIAVGGFVASAFQGIGDSIISNVVAVKDLVTPEYWKSLVKFFKEDLWELIDNERTRFQIGLSIGESNAEEDRQLAVAPPFEYGMTLGHMFGVAITEIVLLFIGFGEVVAALKATKLAKVAQPIFKLAEKVAEVGVVSKGLNVLKASVEKINDIKARVNLLLNKLPALTRRGRMEKNLEKAEQEVSKVLKRIDELEAASRMKLASNSSADVNNELLEIEQAVRELEEKLAQFEGKVDDAYNMGVKKAAKAEPAVDAAKPAQDIKYDAQDLTDHMKSGRNRAETAASEKKAFSAKTDSKEADILLKEAAEKRKKSAETDLKGQDAVSSSPVEVKGSKVDEAVVAKPEAIDRVDLSRDKKAEVGNAKNETVAEKAEGKEVKKESSLEESPKTKTASTGKAEICIMEVQELFITKFKGPAPPKDTYLIHGTADEFAKAYRAVPGVAPDAPIPAGYIDLKTGKINLPPDAEMHTVIHESLHWVGNSPKIHYNDPAFIEILKEYGVDPKGVGGTKNILSTYVDEGITEWMTRKALGPLAGEHPYDPNVEFIRLLTNVIGEKPVEDAFLHGQWVDFMRVLEKELGGKENAKNFFKLMKRPGVKKGEIYNLEEAELVLRALKEKKDTEKILSSIEEELSDVVPKRADEIKDDAKVYHYKDEEKDITKDLTPEEMNPYNTPRGKSAAKEESLAEAKKPKKGKENLNESKAKAESSEKNKKREEAKAEEKKPDTLPNVDTHKNVGGTKAEKTEAVILGPDNKPLRQDLQKPRNPVLVKPDGEPVHDIPREKLNVQIYGPDGELQRGVPRHKLPEVLYSTDNRVVKGPRRNKYPGFKGVDEAVEAISIEQVKHLSKNLGIPIPEDRVLAAPWVGKVRNKSGEIMSSGTSQGWLRSESGFWLEFKNRWPDDYKLLGSNRTVSPELAKKYSWKDSLVGEKFVHHHMENGQFVVAVPESLHKELSGLIHAKPTVVGY